MSEEVEVPTGEQSDAAPAEAQNTEPAAGQMIPKSRFDEVNTRLKELEKANAEAAKEAEKQLQLQAEEQGRFKELYEQAQAELLAAQETAKNAEIARLKNEAAHRHNLPAAIAARLIGETEEDIEADALKLAEVLPKAQPETRTDAAAGRNGRQPTPEKSDREIQEMAARLGVSFEHLKRQYTRN